MLLPWRSEMTNLAPGFNKLASLRKLRDLRLDGICIHTALSNIRSKLISCLVTFSSVGSESSSQSTFNPGVCALPILARAAAGSMAVTDRLVNWPCSAKYLLSRPAPAPISRMRALGLASSGVRK